MMNKNGLNIAFIVINTLEIALGVGIGGALLLIGSFLLIFSGLDGSEDLRVPSAFMMFFLIATVATAIASLVLSIICIVTRKKIQTTGMGQIKGKWITSIVLGGTNIFFLFLFFVAFLFLLL